MRWSASLRVLFILSVFQAESTTLEDEGSLSPILLANGTGILNTNQTLPEVALNITDYVSGNVSLEYENPEVSDSSTTTTNQSVPIIPLSYNETLIYGDDNITEYDIEEVLGPIVDEIKSDYDPQEANFTSEDIYYASSFNESLMLSSSTVSWLEAFMLQHRDSYWMVFNITFMLIWILVGLFSLYRLFGLPLCSSLLSRTLYLVIHLLIFIAATFSVVFLLHLCFGSYEGLPLFLTLLLTHTPIPCLASCSILITYCIFFAARVPIYKAFLPSFFNLTIFVSSLIGASFFGDIIVGITHSSVALIIFRGSINLVCISLFLIFLIRYKKILQVARLLRREFSGELKSLVIPLNIPKREFTMEIKNKLKDILVLWSFLTLLSCISGTIMCLCSLFLSLFFTVSFVPLWLFWFIHTLLFLSQVAIIISVTLAAALTLVDADSRNIISKYFILAFPTANNRCDPYIKHGNYIYQRVSYTNMPPTCSNNVADESSTVKNNEVTLDLPDQRPRNSLRRAVTFNCGQQEGTPFYSKKPLNPILSETCIPCSNLDGCNCTYKDLNAPYCSNCRQLYRRSRCFESEEKETPYAYCGKYPRKNYYGRGKFSSLRNLANGAPQTGVETELTSIKLASTPLDAIPLPQPIEYSTNSTESETYLHSPTDKECVTQIILENQQLFNPLLRKHSLRDRSPRIQRASTQTKLPPSPLHMNKQRQEPSPMGFHQDDPLFLPKPPKSPPPPPPPQNLSPPSKYLLDSNNVTPIEEKATINKAQIVKDSYIINENVPLEENLNEIAKEDLHKITKEVATSETTCNTHCSKEPSKIISYNDYDSFTLPSPKRASLKRNHSSAGDFHSSYQPKQSEPDQYSNLSLSNSKLKYPWYGTWSGRRSKKRPNAHEVSEGLNVGLRRLSGSKGSLSSLYGKLKPKRNKAMTHPPEHIALDNHLSVEDTQAAQEEQPQEEEEEEEEILPSISEDIDLASEIFKSSSLLANFYAVPEETEESLLENDNSDSLLTESINPNKNAPISSQESSIIFQEANPIDVT